MESDQMSALYILRLLLTLLLLPLINVGSAWVVPPPPSRCPYRVCSFLPKTNGSSTHFKTTTRCLVLNAAADSIQKGSGGDDDDDEDDAAEPGTMRVSEIKAELDLRGVSFADCFDRESLIQKLVQARTSGQADPSILQQFNKQRLEKQFASSSTTAAADSSTSSTDSAFDDIINAAVANDGSLPGGLTPEMFQKLIGNPEVMLLLQNTKMQEAMQLMMTGGSSELEQKIRDDAELRETVEKLNSILKSLQ